MSFVKSIFNTIFNLLRFNNKNWKAVVLCIFAATVFWFFNALNKSYTANIGFPLAFDFNRQGYVPTRPLPHEVRINVTGIGWNLFRRSVGLKVPSLVIPLERPSEVKKIVGSALPAMFANQLEGMEINFVLTDTLYLSIEPKATRWVTLRLDSPSILFRKGFGISGKPLIVPDSVYIDGPLKLITSLSEPVYLKLAQRNIDENFNNDIEIRFLNDELIRRSPQTVTVSFPVEKLEEVTDSIQLELINIPKGARPLIESKTVPCTFAIPESGVSMYNRDSVKVVVDLKNFRRGEMSVLPSLKGLPPFTRIVKNDSIRIKL